MVHYITYIFDDGVVLAGHRVVVDRDVVVVRPPPKMPPPAQFDHQFAEMPGRAVVVVLGLFVAAVTAVAESVQDTYLMVIRALYSSEEVIG